MMTEEQIKKARYIVDKLDTALADDPYYEGAWYTRYGRNKIEFSASVKQVPRYKYVSCEITLDDLNDLDSIIEQLINDWKQSTSPEDIKKFEKFITFGEKYGWD